MPDPAEPAAPKKQFPSAPVVVGDRVIFTLSASAGGFTPVERAGIINQRIKRVLTEKELAPEDIAISASEDTDAVLVGIGDFALIGVYPQDAAIEAGNPTTAELAGRWERTLRETLINAKPLYKGDEPHKPSFFPLLLVSGLAFLVPFAAARSKIKFPVVVGEIIVGIIIGRSGFNLVRDEAALQFLSEFGFAFLMFLSGLEVDVDLLSAPKDKDAPKPPWFKNPIILGVVILMITLVLSFGVSLLFTQTSLVKQPYLMALVLSTTSLGLVVPILKEQGLTTKPFGQTLLMTALIADFVTMFLITIIAGLLSVGMTLNLFLSLVLIGVFLGAMRLGRMLKGNRNLQKFLKQKTFTGANQVAVRGSIVMMLAFVALSETLGTEVILGAFLAGVLLALFLDRGEGELKEKLEGFGFGFVIPIFFIMVGVRFDLRALVGNPQGLILAPLLVVAAVAIKIIASLPFRLVVSWRETFAGGFLMASRLSLIIAAAEIGLRLGVFGETLHAAIICVALVTCVIGPMGFNALMPKPAAVDAPDEE